MRYLLCCLLNLHIILHQGSETILSGLPVQLPVQKPKLPAVPFDAIPAPDVPLHIAKKNFELAESEEEKEAALREYGKLT